MHSSGILVTEELQKAFQANDEDPECLTMNIQIVDDAFTKISQANKTSSQTDDWTAVTASMADSTPAYVLMRTSTGKWMVILYIPDTSPVRMKMVYAASKASLKSGFGAAKFIADYPISTKSEATLEEYQKSTGCQKEVVMSFEEKLKIETHYEAAHAMSDMQASTIVGIPIKIADNTMVALKGIQDGTVTTVELILDGTTEILGSADPSTASFAEFVFPAKEPRYFVTNYKHEHEGEEKNKVVLVYYCPGNAPPKLKMFYSTCKANVIKIFANIGITSFTNLECDCAEECTEDLVRGEIYPKAAADTSFKKPVARGRGKRTVAKFKA